MSAVMTVRFVSPRSRARASMKPRCLCEFDTAVIRLCGNRSAIDSDSDPHPQPSSSTRCASASRARSMVRASMASSESARLLTPDGQYPQLYFSLGPSTFSKKAAGTS